MGFPFGVRTRLQEMTRSDRTRLGTSRWICGCPCSPKTSSAQIARGSGSLMAGRMSLDLVLFQNSAHR